MELGRRAGIETAEIRLLALGFRKCLLVKRFDINEAGGRNHLISMQSGWSTVFAACNVPEKDAESIGKNISHRLKETNPAPLV